MAVLISCGEMVTHRKGHWPYSVFAAFEDVGSTEHIIKRVTNAPAGTKWAVGTEIHLVNRLTNENPDRFIVPLDDCGCLCSTMFRIDAPHLLWALENLAEGRVVNQISVPKDVAADARIALQRMLEITN